LGQSGSSALPYDTWQGDLLKKGVDEPKRLARTLAPPLSVYKIEKHIFAEQA
jgi:hypothetical protein